MAVATTCLAAGAVAVGSASATALPAPAPAPSAAQVIASQIVDLEAASHHWSIGGGVIDPAEPASPPPPAAARFVVAVGGTVVAADSADSPVGQLGVGEAIPLPPGDVSLFAAGDQQAAFVSLQLLAGDPPSDEPDVSASFQLGAGIHDVDLARAVLPPDEIATVAGSDAPLLVVVTGGTVEVAGERLTQGDTRALVGDVEVANAGDAEATFVAAVVAPLADVLADESTTPPTSPPPTTSPSPPTESAEPPTTAPQQAATTTEPTATEAPTTPVPATGEFGQDGTVSVSFSPANPPPGGTIEVTGSGCEPGETVRVGTWPTSGGADVETTTQSDADGAFTTTTTIPADLAPGDQFGVRVDCGVGAGELATDGRFALTYGDAGASPGPAEEREAPPEDEDPAEEPADGGSDDAASDQNESALTGTWRNTLRQTGISEIFYISMVTIEPAPDELNTYLVTHHHECHNGTQLLAVYELAPVDATWEESPQPVETSGECETSPNVDVSFEYTGPVVWALEADGSLRRVAPLLSHPNEAEFDDVSVWELVDEE